MPSTPNATTSGLSGFPGTWGCVCIIRWSRTYFEMASAGVGAILLPRAPRNHLQILSMSVPPSMKAPLSSSKVSGVGVDREPFLCVLLAACRVRSGPGPRTTFYPCRPRGAGHPILCSPCGEPGMLVGRSPLLTRGLLSGPAALRAPSTSSAVSSSSPPPGPQGRGLCFQRRPLRDHSLLQEAPQVDQQLACYGDDPHLPGALATATETLLVPQAQLAPRLVAQPAPGHFDRHRPDRSAPRLADPLLPASVPALIRRGCQAGGRADFFPVPEPPPSEELMHIHPRPARPDRSQQHQLPHLFECRTPSFEDRLPPLPLQLEDLPVQELRVLPLPLQARQQSCRQRRTVPQPQPLQPSAQVPTLYQPDPLVRQQSLDPVRRPRPLLLQRPQLTVQLPPVLLLHRRHPHHAPHLPLSRVVPHQHGQQLARVQPVRLRPPLPPLHLDARRIHPPVVDASQHEVPVQPETVPPRLVAAPQPRRRCQPEAPLRLHNLALQSSQVAGRHRPHPRLRPQIRREPQLPVLEPQLERQVQNLLRRSGILTTAGRSGHLRLLSPLLTRFKGAYQRRPASLLTPS